MDGIFFIYYIDVFKYVFNRHFYIVKTLAAALANLGNYGM